MSSGSKICCRILRFKIQCKSLTSGRRLGTKTRTRSCGTTTRPTTYHHWHWTTAAAAAAAAAAIQGHWVSSLLLLHRLLQLNTILFSLGVVLQVILQIPPFPPPPPPRNSFFPTSRTRWRWNSIPRRTHWCAGIFKQQMEILFCLK